MARQMRARTREHSANTDDVSTSASSVSVYSQDTSHFEA